MSWLRVENGVEWCLVRPNVELHVSLSTFRVRCAECKAGETWKGAQFAPSEAIRGILDDFAASHQHAAAQPEPGGIGEGAL